MTNRPKEAYSDLPRYTIYYTINTVVSWYRRCSILQYTKMEFKNSSIVLHLFLSLLIHTQVEAVDSLNQTTLSSIDQKRHLGTVETISFPADFMRRQLAGGGGSSGGGGGGGSRGGSSGGSSGGGGGGSKGGSSGGGGGGGSRGGGRSRGGSSGGSGGNKGGGDDGDSGSGGGSGGNGNGGNTIPSTTTTQGGRFPSGGIRLQHSLVFFLFTISLVVLILNNF
ncbi:glycine-rich RNA-binding protein 3, mitochondrial isoform X3 [Raphanus sativus]|uniref:Glycine-rich RNA-binding protein 3, mitochondrial isoform X3 n=1 Tax=Raphanus sativus TaxID=3726 RepID=A0A9W3DE68_RAPSA|nr:glycine-rich RNA-binding protein 3, mitochondrial isoform X3 [Raphanus sativus]